MVKLNVLELLKKQGRTKYWLYKQLGMSYQNFNRMVNNETQSIKLERTIVSVNIRPNRRGIISAWGVLFVCFWPEPLCAADLAVPGIPSAVPEQRGAHESSPY